MKVSCKEIATAIQHLMGMANFLGYVNQVEGEEFLQFSVKSITEDEDGAITLLNFGEQDFKISVSFDTGA